MTGDEIVFAIVSGALDDVLRDVARATKERFGVLDGRKMMMFRPDQRVWVNAPGHPRWHEMVGTVVKPNRTTVTVAFEGEGEVRVPAALLEMIE